jgi:hypothetical protein
VLLRIKQERDSHSEIEDKSQKQRQRINIYQIILIRFQMRACSDTDIVVLGLSHP